MERFPRVTHPSAGDTEVPPRLACVKPAASVRSEPGSNSQVHPSRQNTNYKLLIKSNHLRDQTLLGAYFQRYDNHASINALKHQYQPSPTLLFHPNCQSAYAIRKLLRTKALTCHRLVSSQTARAPLQGRRRRIRRIVVRLSRGRPFHRCSPDRALPSRERTYRPVKHPRQAR